MPHQTLAFPRRANGAQKFSICRHAVDHTEAGEVRRVGAAGGWCYGEYAVGCFVSKTVYRSTHVISQVLKIFCDDTRLQSAGEGRNYDRVTGGFNTWLLEYGVNVPQARRTIACLVEPRAYISHFSSPRLCVRGCGKSSEISMWRQPERIEGYFAFYQAP